MILEEINASGCVASQGHAQMYIMGTLLRHGSETQKRQYLPEIAAGRLRLQAFGVTEPTTGSDTTQLKTRAVRDGDHYVVTGQKVWTSRALHSDMMLLLARTSPVDQVKKRSDGLSVFLVDLSEKNQGKGLEIRPIQAMINHNTTEVFFDNFRIPASSLIGEEGRGFRYILDGMNAERVLVASEAVGDGRWFVKKATAYANDRVVFGSPIGRNQAVQFPIARAWAELEAADMVCRRAAALFDDGKDCGADANIAKLLASEACWKAADTCMQTFGGFSYAREYEIERKWREFADLSDRTDLHEPDPGLCRPARAGDAAVVPDTLGLGGQQRAGTSASYDALVATVVMAATATHKCAASAASVRCRLVGKDQAEAGHPRLAAGVTESRGGPPSRTMTLEGCRTGTRTSRPDKKIGPTEPVGPQEGPG